MVLPTSKQVSRPITEHRVKRLLLDQSGSRPRRLSALSRDRNRGYVAYPLGGHPRQPPVVNCHVFAAGNGCPAVSFAAVETLAV